jgi:hypothetical protein
LIIDKGTTGNSPTPFSSMMFWALIFATDMVPGEMGRAAKEPKSRVNMDEMLG